MCGRFYLASSPEELVRFFGVSDLSMIQPRFNIAPSTPVAILRAADRSPSRQLAHVQWGLIPSWAGKKPDFKGLINARGETAREKPSFRNSFKRRRCLIPASGFYEWANTGGKKEPFAFQRADGAPLAFAGLWDRVLYENGSELETCTILTTVANKLVRPIHDRMPVILHPEDYDSWLFTPEERSESPGNYMKPFPEEEMEMFPVNDLVNNPRHDDPDIFQSPSGARFGDF